MDYKSFFFPDEDINFFSIKEDCSLEDDSMEKPSLSEEEATKILETAGHNLFLLFSKSTQNVLKILEILRSFRYVKYVSNVCDLFFGGQIFTILVQLLKLNSSISDEYLPVCVSDAIEEIIELSLKILLHMSHYSEQATEYIVSSKFIPIFLENEKDYSSISKKNGFYILSNIYLSMPDDAFICFIKDACANLKNENVQDSDARIFTIIWDEKDTISLQVSLFNLLHVICYRISNLSQQEKPSKDLSEYIINKIFVDILENTIRIEPKSRKELYFSIFHLCCAFPDISAYIASDSEKIKLFVNCFQSSDEEIVEFSLKFFCLLFNQAPETDIKLNMIDCLPWSRLNIMLENHYLTWHRFLFKFVEDMSIDQAFVDRGWENGVYEKIILLSDEVPLESRIEIGRMFINILNKIPPEACIPFIQNGVLQNFFDLLDLESNPEFIDDILNTLHEINQKLISISQEDVVVNEYKKYDAVSLLQELPDLGEKTFLLCKELNLVEEDEE